MGCNSQSRVQRAWNSPATAPVPLAPAPPYSAASLAIVVVMPLRRVDRILGRPQCANFKFQNFLPASVEHHTRLSESNPSWPSPSPLGNPESSNSALRYVDAFLVDFSRSTVLNVSFRFDCIEPPCQPLVSTAGTMFLMLSTPWSTWRTSATRTRFVLKGQTQSIVG